MSKVYEFGGGQVREHLGGIYDFLQTKKIADLKELEKVSSVQLSKAENNIEVKQQKADVTSSKTISYNERKEQQKKIRKTERLVEESERKIAQMEQRLKELDELLCDPKNASDMTLVSEYTDIKRNMDEEVTRWEQFSEELDALNSAS